MSVMVGLNKSAKAEKPSALPVKEKVKKASKPRKTTKKKVD